MYIGITYIDSYCIYIWYDSDEYILSQTNLSIFFFLDDRDTKLPKLYSSTIDIPRPPLNLNLLTTVT